MANDPKLAGGGLKKPDDFVQADPTKNPRYQAQQEIWAKSAQRADDEAKEAFPVDPLPEEFEPAPDSEAGVELKGKEEAELGEPEAPAQAARTDEAPPAAEGGAEPKVEAEEPGIETIEADATYEGIIDGKPVEIPGWKLIEAGYRTFQKEAAADVKLALANERLQTADQLLKTAAARVAELSQGTPTAQGGEKGPRQDAPQLSETELARAIQFGTEEQAASALKQLRAGANAVTKDDLPNLFQQLRNEMRTENVIHEARAEAAKEYPEIMANPYLKSLFDGMEMQARQNGDNTHPKDLYKRIGDTLRENIPGLGKPAPKAAPATVEQRQAAKKAAPSMPKTAAARISESGEAKKPITASEIIAGMAQSRGQGSLTIQKPH